MPLWNGHGGRKGGVSDQPPFCPLFLGKNVVYLAKKQFDLHLPFGYASLKGRSDTPYILPPWELSLIHI